MMMHLNKWTMVAALAGALMLAGCGKRQADGQPSASDNSAVATTEAQQPVLAPGDSLTAAPISDSATNAATPAAEFLAKSMASPFAAADLGLKESYDRALIAFQIGDYARVASELQDLAGISNLTPPQKEAVQNLLLRTLKLAPDLAATNMSSAGTASAQVGVPAEFPVTVPGTVESPKNVLESPFSTADPAIKDSFARAKAAYNIGNYESALAELQDLATNTQLNFQQKYAVQSLLDKMPRK
jgi:outer membrane murein-binding lipoprotein Lpp